MRTIDEPIEEFGLAIVFHLYQSRASRNELLNPGDCDFIWFATQEEGLQLREASADEAYIVIAQLHAFDAK